MRAFLFKNIPIILSEVQYNTLLDRFNLDNIETIEDLLSDLPNSVWGYGINRPCLCNDFNYGNGNLILDIVPECSGCPFNYSNFPPIERQTILLGGRVVVEDCQIILIAILGYHPGKHGLFIHTDRLSWKKEDDFKSKDTIQFIRKKLESLDFIDIPDKELVRCIN